jgi:probable HAF family extracellular repeat protein
VTDLGSLGSAPTSATGINDAGQVTGTSVTAAGATRAYLWSGGTMTNLGATGGSSSFGQAVAVGPFGPFVTGSVDQTGPPGGGLRAGWGRSPAGPNELGVPIRAERADEHVVRRLATTRARCHDAHDNA